MSKRRICITKDGNVVALCDNVIENIGIGKKEIKRAADVEFNNDRQLWEIIAPGGEILGTHERRDKAIELEIQLMNAKIREQHTCGVAV